MVLADRCRTANRGRCRTAPTALAVAALALALAGCTVGPDTGPDPEVDTADYPALTTVPPRPRLSYSVEQRREIASALISDRANARYNREVARYEGGLSEQPPPGSAPAVVEEPTPPESGVDAIPAKPEEPVPPGGGLIAEMAIRQQVLTERNNGRLESFLDILQRQLALNQQAEAAGFGMKPDQVQPDTLPGRPPARAVNVPPAAAPAAAHSPAAPVEAPAPPTASAAPEANTAERNQGLSTFSSYLGGLLGIDTMPPAAAPEAPAAAPPPPSTASPAAVASAPAPAAGPTAAAPASPPFGAHGDRPVRLAFAPRSSQPPAEAEATLRAAVDAARSSSSRLVVEGLAPSPALGLDRARSVASWLMRLGAPADMVSLKGGGAGEGVLIHLLPSDAA